MWEPPPTFEMTSISQDVTIGRREQQLQQTSLRKLKRLGLFFRQITTSVWISNLYPIRCSN